jgi:putative phage-type endonuclease
MKLLKLEQGSKEWLKWRTSVVTATDAPVIVDASPYKTPYFLYMQKKGLYPIDEPNERMLRGSLLEPQARLMYELEKGELYFPSVVVHDEFPWLAASLDGLSEDMTKACEIKCNGRKSHQMATVGEIPVVYLWQLQHQMLVTGLSSIDYFSYDGHRGLTVKVARCADMINILLEKAKAFYECLQNNVPPEKNSIDLQRDLAEREYDEYFKTIM